MKTLSPAQRVLLALVGVPSLTTRELSHATEIPVESLVPLLDAMAREKQVEGRVYALTDWLGMEWRRHP